jgi:urea transport system ATP-binding protein
MNQNAVPGSLPDISLSVANLVVSYGAVSAVAGVSFTAAAGEVTCIMGRNGVGKTTLLRSIMGQIPAKAGTVALGGTDLSGLPAPRRARQGIALVPQGREIFPRLTVRENLEVAFSARGRRDNAAIDEVMGMFPILRQFTKRMGGDLSGGQQQQLAIARALVGNPKVLLLDEPTEGIQPNIIDEIGVVLRRLACERGMVVVLVEQYVAFVRETGHRFLAMERGKVVASGTTAELTDEVVAKHLNV